MFLNRIASCSDFIMLFHSQSTNDQSVYKSRKALKSMIHDSLSQAQFFFLFKHEIHSMDMQNLFQLEIGPNSIDCLFH